MQRFDVLALRNAEADGEREVGLRAQPRQKAGELFRKPVTGAGHTHHADAVDEAARSLHDLVDARIVRGGGCQVDQVETMSPADRPRLVRFFRRQIDDDQSISAGVRRVRDHRELLALASIVVVAFAPPCEELFFRGFLFPGLARRWGIAAGIVASGLLFSSAHLLPKSFIPIAGVGMVFAFTYWRSGNILSTMLAHLSFNSLSIAFIAGGSCDTSSVGMIHPALVHWSPPF